MKYMFSINVIYFSEIARTFRMRVLHIICRFEVCDILMWSSSSEKKIPWIQSVSELYRLSDRRLSAKLVPTFADGECYMMSTTDPYCLILDFLNWSRYYFFQVAPQLYSRGWEDTVPDPLFLRKSGSSGNRTQNLWICSGPTSLDQLDLK
jgi:hypothetical protein